MVHLVLGEILNLVKIRFRVLCSEECIAKKSVPSSCLQNSILS